MGPGNSSRIERDIRGGGGNGFGGGGGEATKLSENSPIDDSFQRAIESISILGEKLAVLDKRLSPVLHDIPPVPENGTKNPEPNVKKVTGKFEAINQTIRTYLRNVNEILETLEV